MLIEGFLSTFSNMLPNYLEITYWEISKIVLGDILKNLYNTVYS